MDYLLGSIMMFSGNFVPRDWASCQGALLAISQNQALFAVLGAAWGGDGRSNLGLPDLSSRVPVGTGAGPGLHPVNQGDAIGREAHKLLTPELPSHTHAADFAPESGGAGSSIQATVTVNANSGSADKAAATGNYWATIPGGIAGTPSYSETKNSTMATDAVTVNITGGAVTISPTGGNQAFSLLNPSLGMNFMIVIEGQFPARN